MFGYPGGEDFQSGSGFLHGRPNQAYQPDPTLGGAPKPSSAHDGYPGAGYPDEGYPGADYPGGGYPGADYPGGGYPIDDGYPAYSSSRNHRSKKSSSRRRQDKSHKSDSKGGGIASTVKIGTDIVKGLVARSLFVVHSGLVVWRVATVADEDWSWFLLGLLGLLLFETFVTLCFKQGKENRWFSFCTFLFLCAVVPGLWLLELDRLDRYKAANSTVEREAEALSEVYGVQLPVTLDPDLWVLALEQMLLFVLIIGRWILPKGSISRSQLSLLLLVYIGMASDIMDVFVLFEEPQVLDDDVLGYIILGVWSLSLVQFCLVLTVTKGSGDQSMSFGTSYTKHGRRKQVGCCHTEMWSILTTIFMQDSPFLAIRLWVMIKYKTFNYSLLFFSFKNALVILVQLYRLCIVCGDQDDDVERNNRGDANRSSRRKRRHKRLMPEFDLHLDPRFHGY